MRIAKLFAYLALAILLPLWLYNLSGNELNEAKNKQVSAEAEKKENEKLINAIYANKQGQTEINFNSNHLDSLFYLIAKSNQNARQNTQVTVSPNPQTESSLQELIQISTANATALQGLLSKDRNISVSVSPIDINQRKVDSASTNQNDFPVYDFSEKGNYPFWKILLKRNFNPTREKYFLVLNNISQTDTAYIFNITSDDTIMKINPFSFSKNQNSILPQNQIVIPYDFGDNSPNLYYITGVLKGKGKRGRPRTKEFRIPVIIDRQQ